MIQPGEPLLGISFYNMDGSKRNLFKKTKNFSRKYETNDKKITFELISSENIKITREYWRENNSSYMVNHLTIIENLNDFPVQVDKVRLHLGSAFQIPRLYNPFDNSSTYLNVGYYNDGPPYQKAVLVHNAVVELMEKLRNLSSLMKWVLAERWNRNSSRRQNGTV